MRRTRRWVLQMDEQWLRELLDREIDSGPPGRPMAANSLRAGIRLRRRRRAQGGAACVAAAAMVATVLGVTAATRTPVAGPAKVTRPSTVYVLSSGSVTPISTATDRPGKPIPLPVGGSDMIMAVTPNGKTIYLGGDEPNPVVPFSTVTDTMGKPIQIGTPVSQILITPNGKTAYVLPLVGGKIIPIATATNSPEKAIKVGMTFGGGNQMAITPDGKTLYVISAGKPFKGPSYVIPISTATNTPGEPIEIRSTDVFEIVMNPDGRTAYAIGQSATGAEIVPITTATNTPRKPVRAAPADGPLAITPDGRILYLAGPSGVTAFATATNTPGKLIKIDGFVYAIVVTPDGETAYVPSEPPARQTPPGCAGPPGKVTPIETATNTPGRSIPAGCNPYAVAITPDGKTIWVGSSDRKVTPIATATNTPGKPITIDGVVVAIAVAPRP